MHIEIKNGCFCNFFLLYYVVRAFYVTELDILSTNVFFHVLTVFVVTKTTTGSSENYKYLSCVCGSDRVIQPEGT